MSYVAADQRVTQAFLVPTMLARIDEQLRHSGTAPPSTLRAIAYGGGAMPRSQIDELRALHSGLAQGRSPDLVRLNNLINDIRKHLQ